MVKLDKHQWQGISLLIAAGLLWVPVGLDHMTAMAISTVIIVINALMELGD